MKIPNENRLPNFAKVALAILEAKVETIIGKDAINEIKNPFARKEVEKQIVLAAERAEKRFVESYPEDEISTALKELPIANLPTMKIAIVNFYDHPTDPKFQSELENQLKQILPKEYSNQRVISAAKDYLSFFWQEATEIDELREKLGILSVLEIKENTGESTSLLRAIDRKLGVLIDKEIINPPSHRSSKRAYSALAGSDNPALILYLIDIGKYADKTIDGIHISDLISDALQSTFSEMIGRSLRQDVIKDRYHVGCYAYASDVIDIWGGIKPISEIAKIGLPRLKTTNERADTAKAFLYVEKVLSNAIKGGYRNRPAPLICHITSGEYGGRDPEPIAKRIKDIRVEDGNILIENVLMEDEAILDPLSNPMVWSGIHREDQLAKAFPQKLFQMSSVIPESYREHAQHLGFNISRGTRMLYPVTKPEIIKLGITYGVVTGMAQMAKKREV